jgi:hypothetical protein
VAELTSESYKDNSNRKQVAQQRWLGPKCPAAATRLITDNSVPASSVIALWPSWLENEMGLQNARSAAPPSSCIYRLPPSAVPASAGRKIATSAQRKQSQQRVAVAVVNAPAVLTRWPHSPHSCARAPATREATHDSAAALSWVRSVPHDRCLSWEYCMCEAPARSTSFG